MKVSAQSSVTIAGLVWIVGGAMLMVRGSPYWVRCLKDNQTLGIVVLVAALGIGIAKGVFVLSKASRRMIRRIEAKAASLPVWEIYPLYFYPLIAVMIGMGVAVRHFFGVTHPAIVAGVYLGIGAALLSSAPPYLAAARKFKRVSASAEESS